jgi:hypothetical protein
MNKDQNSYKPSSQQGSGSAENTGRSRREQKNRNIDLSGAEKQNIARDAGINKKDLRDISDLGGRSGRDDYAGGDNEGISNESTDEATER